MRSLVSAMLPIASSLKCDQIRRFLKFSVTKILSKEAPKYGKTWATWKHIALKLKIDFTTFWQQFGQIWAIFYFTLHPAKMLLKPLTLSDDDFQIKRLLQI